MAPSHVRKSLSCKSLSNLKKDNESNGPATLLTTESVKRKHFFYVWTVDMSHYDYRPIGQRSDSLSDC